MIEEQGVGLVTLEVLEADYQTTDSSQDSSDGGSQSDGEQDDLEPDQLSYKNESMMQAMRKKK